MSEDPEVIRARAEAKERVLKARAELHPVSQAIHTLFESAGDLLHKIGCLIIIVIVILAFLAPYLLEALANAIH